jgi:UDP-2,3-diacylglucosamine hydrolase
VSHIFASDLHLGSERPEKVSLFEDFLKRASGVADSLYILGDLFDIWLGDDDDSDPHPKTVRAMREFADSGARLFVMSGNRDFLLGDEFERASGATLLDDWHTLDLYGARTLLTHGDLLCTKDIQYQAFRKYVRDPENQKRFLAQPVDERRKIAADTRNGTKASMSGKDDFIMDVEQSTVERIMGEFQVVRLIHGHTHRPAIHTFRDGGTEFERVVLGDWYEDGMVAVYDQSGLRRMSVADFVAAPNAATA